MAATELAVVVIIWIKTYSHVRLTQQLSLRHFSSLAACFMLDGELALAIPSYIYEIH